MGDTEVRIWPWVSSKTLVTPKNYRAIFCDVLFPLSVPEIASDKQ